MGCDFVDLTAELLVLVEHWPLDLLLGEVATVVVGDADGVCHTRDCSMLFSVLWKQSDQLALVS
jgi:hypothetical protein